VVCGSLRRTPNDMFACKSIHGRYEAGEPIIDGAHLLYVLGWMEVRDMSNGMTSRPVKHGMESCKQMDSALSDGILYLASIGDLFF